MNCSPNQESHLEIKHLLRLWSLTRPGFTWVSFALSEELWTYCEQAAGSIIPTGIQSKVRKYHNIFSKGGRPTGPAQRGQHRVLLTGSSTTPGMASDEPGPARGTGEGQKDMGHLRVHLGDGLPAEKSQGTSRTQGHREGRRLAFQPCGWGRAGRALGDR